MADYTAYAVAKTPTSADRARYEAKGYVQGDTVTLLVPASGLAITPLPGDTLTWASNLYTVREVGKTWPDGTALLYELVASK